MVELCNSFLLICQQGLWSDEDLERILGDYGAFVVIRKGTDLVEALKSLEKWRENIFVSVRFILAWLYSHDNSESALDFSNLVLALA